MRRFAPALLCIALVALAAEPAHDLFLREGDAAFRRGDYRTAVERYERAGLRTTQPALVAFDLAAAKYRRALSSPADRASDLAEAGRYFSCCTGAEDPRRGQAFAYLGACLLHQALDGNDGGLASRAVEALEAALREPGADEAMADDVRHNLALARLLVAQSVTPPDQPPAKDNPAKEERQPAQQEQRPMGMEQGPNGMELVPNPSKDKTGDKKVEIPGENLPRGTPRGTDPRRDPRTDETSTEPADAHHLRDALDRILREQETHKRQKSQPPAVGVKNW